MSSINNLSRVPNSHQSQSLPPPLRSPDVSCEWWFCLREDFDLSLLRILRFLRELFLVTGGSSDEIVSFWCSKLLPPFGRDWELIVDAFDDLGLRSTGGGSNGLGIIGPPTLWWPLELMVWWVGMFWLWWLLLVFACDEYLPGKLEIILKIKNSVKCIFLYLI